MSPSHIYIPLYSFISIQPYRPGWQEPEPSHVTGMALAHCIMGKCLGVVCHCFPPSLGVPTFAARCLYVRNDARDPSSERWNCGREICPVIMPKFRLPRKFRDLFTCRKSTTWDRRLYFPSEGRRAEDFYALKNPTASAGFEPANLGIKGQHATPRPPKPLATHFGVGVAVHSFTTPSTSALTAVDPEELNRQWHTAARCSRYSSCRTNSWLISGM